jgi:hypothetical protein
VISLFQELTTHSIQKTQTSMSLAGLGTAVSASEQTHTHAVESEVTRIAKKTITLQKSCIIFAIFSGMVFPIKHM